MFRILALAAAIAATAGLASAAGSMSNPPTETIVCLDVSGASVPAICNVPSSRLDKREDFCRCPEGVRTPVAVCAKGQKAPAETVALDRARRLASQDGSLVGDMYDGQSICVAPRE